MSESPRPPVLPPDRDSVRSALARRDADTLRAWAEDEPQELADLLADLLDDVHDRETVVAAELLGDQLTADVVTEMDPGEAADLLERLSPADAADVLEEMAPDDAADVVEELDQAEAESVLGQMDTEEATELRELLAWPPDSAGGIMTPDFAAVRPTLTVDEAIAEIRRLADQAETVHYVYVTDGTERLLGVLSLHDLVRARPGLPVTSVMREGIARVHARADQEAVARLFRDERYMALPVVDDGDRLLGIITVDDVADVVEEEATEDIERIGGSQPLDEPYLRAGVLQIVRKRIVWLIFLLVAQSYTATVLSGYSGEMQAMVQLALFIPMLVGMGGNVGSQTVTTLIRAIGVDDVNWGDFAEVLWKELRVSLILGLVLAGGMLLRASLLGVSVDVATVVGLSAGFIVLWAGLVAAVLPLTLRRLGVDPAVVSAPLITTLVDGTGLIIYFELARRLLAL